jgi:zona occludens toxin (predicted ATPase)
MRVVRFVLHCVILKKKKKSMDVFKHHRNLNGRKLDRERKMPSPRSLWSQTHSTIILLLFVVLSFSFYVVFLLLDVNIFSKKSA